MTVSAISAQDAAATVLCKTPGCDREAAWTGGPLKGLCTVCAVPIRDRMSEKQRLSYAERRETRPAVAGGGFENRAKALVTVGRNLDRAVAAYKRKQHEIEPAKQALDAAMREWRLALQALATSAREEP